MGLSRLTETIRKKNEKNHKSACDHSQCCHYSSINGCSPIKKTHVPKSNAGVQCVVTSDAGIQTSVPSHTLTFPETFNLKSRKRRREPSSSDENVPTKITTTAIVHKDSGKKLASDKNRSISSEEHNGRNRKIPSLKLNRADSTKYNIYQRKRTNSSDSVVWVVLPKNKIIKENHRSKQKTEYLKPKSKHISKTRKHDGTKFNTSSKSRQRSDIKTSAEQIDARTKRDKKQKTTETFESSSDDQNDITLAKYCQYHKKTDQKNVGERKKVQQDKEQCKELIIDEKDVELLRNYLVGHESDFDLLKFDQDDAYKKQFFFKINPLVSVERCRIIAKMLRRQNQDDISLKDFASQLGLTSVSEVSSATKRYRIRESQETKIYLIKETSDSEIDKENSKYRKHRDGKNNKLHKNAGNAKSDEYDSYSPNSETDSKNSKEQHNIVRRRSQRLEKEKESSKENENQKSSSKRYVTRQSRANFDKNDARDIFSSDANTKVRKLEGSSEVKSSKLQREGNRKREDKINNDKVENIDLTLSTNEESEVESTKPLKEIIRKRYIKTKNKDLAVSDDENSDLELTKSSNDKNRKRLHNSKSKNTDEEDTAEEITKISKEQNKNGKINDNKINANNNKVKNTSLTDSDKENSDEEALKTWKKSNRSAQNEVNITKKNKNRIPIRRKETSDESSEDTSKPSKELRRRIQNKENRNIKNNNDTDSKEDSPKSDEKAKQIHRKGQVNSKININKRSNVNDEDSELELAKSLKDTKKPQNKGNNDVVLKKAEPSKIVQNIANNNDKNTKRYANETPTLRETTRNNQNKPNTTKNTATDILESNSDDEKEVFVKKRNVIGKPSIKDIKSLVKSRHTPSIVSREYSLLEDHAIVTWVSMGGRACCVNGNRIWRELQDSYYNIVGQNRSWHSLRNRYLRYILPKLGTLALPPSQEARLRAAAATGEIKSRKRVARRNSIFGVPSRGALSRRPGASRSSSSEPEPPPKRHKYDHRREKSPSQKRVLRSSLPSSPTKSHSSPTKSRLSPSKSRLSPSKPRFFPRYSDITRHFAATHRQDESTPTTSPKSMENGKSPSSRTRKKEPSETKSSFRRSFRNKELPQKQTENSPEKERTRIKLFNPSAML